MKLNIFILLAVIVGCWILMTLGGCEKKQAPTPPVQSQTEGVAEDANEAVTQAAGAVEQTNCPVMGGKINKDIFVEYKGKKVYFCCPMCVDQFNKDPEKYLSKLPQFQN